MVPSGHMLAAGAPVGMLPAKAPAVQVVGGRVALVGSVAEPQYAVA